MNQATVLVVEDDPDLREVLGETLQLDGYTVETASDGAAALEIMSSRDIGMVVSDVQMRPMDGTELLGRIKNLYPSVPVLLMTAYGDIQKAVSAIRGGAVDYLSKPFEADLLLEKVKHSVLRPRRESGQVIAEDLHSRELFELARRVAASEATVLIGGESGAGKEVVARYIHNQSPRSEGPFVAINCAAIPDNMLEAVLFGYEKGAYTGAHRSAEGKFEQAQGGTLLLDEISEMSLPLQAKLLRVLQEKEVERLGGRKMIPLDVRVLATTNRKLREEVSAGRFREDLYFRLNVFPLHLKPLRERSRDILPLARFLLEKLSDGRPAPKLTVEAEESLLKHGWPGNVRELENVMQRSLILSDGQEIGPEALCFETAEAETDAGDEETGRGGLSADLRSVEEKLIMDALDEESGSRRKVAERLGISERTLRYKIARLRESGVAIPR